MHENRSLRIVFVAPFGLRQKSTVWARTLPLAHELNRTGHSASILVPPWDSPQDAGRVILRDGVKIEHVRLSGGLLPVSMRLVSRIQRESPDIVHIVKPRAYAGIVQWLLWQSRCIGMAEQKLMLDVDDWEKPWAAINRYPRYQAAFLAWQESWGIRHADGITAASGWLTEWASTLAPQTPILYLPNGVSARTGTDEHRYVLRDPPRVLLLSRFVEVEPAWLGDMWRALRAQIPDAVLLVAGRALHAGGEGAFLSALADTGNCAWLGYVPPSDLPGLLGAVDCAIFPSEDTALLSAKCSARLAAVLERGVPTVASSVGEQAAYGAQGAAHLVSPHATPVGFASAVAEVLRSPQYRETLGRAAQGRITSEYAWEKLARRLNRFYAGIISNA